MQHVRAHSGAEPACYMTGGAGWKMAPSMNGDFELVDGLIMDGLLVIAQATRGGRPDVEAQAVDRPSTAWNIACRAWLMTWPFQPSVSV